jgi:hypothetical protein
MEEERFRATAIRVWLNCTDLLTTEVAIDRP